MAATMAFSTMTPNLTVSAATKEKPITRISFPSTVTIKVGETKRLDVITTPSYTTYKTNIAWGAQTNSCFTRKINGFGTYWKEASSQRITGTKVGTGYLNTTVNVFNSNKKFIRKYTFRTTVKVTSNNTKNTTTPTIQPKKTIPLTKIALNKTYAALNVGSTTTLTVSYIPSNTTANKSVTWKSNNTSIAIVSGGKVTAKKSGLTSVYARTKDGKTATCIIRVDNSGEYVNVNECYNMINQYRTRAGKKRIVRNVNLENYAKIRAKELATKYSHTRPNGQRGTDIIPWSLCDKINNSKYAAENIAMRQPTCKTVMEDWYDSKGHRENMLNPNLRKVGIAGYKYNGVMYWVQLFAS